MLTIIITTILQNPNNIQNKKDSKKTVVFTKKANAINYIKNLKDKPVITIKKPVKILDYSDIQGGNYNKGFKYYNRYVYRRTHVKSAKLLQDLNIKTPEQLKLLFANNAQVLIKVLDKKGGKYKEVAKNINPIIRKHKLNDLYKFFIGILNGKIPASCG